MVFLPQYYMNGIIHFEWLQPQSNQFYFCLLGKVVKAAEQGSLNLERVVVCFF